MYIYRLYNANKEIIYVGKTVNKFTKRIRTHFTNYKKYNKNGFWRKKVKYFDVAEVETEANLCLYEIYYINKIKPKNNTSNMGEGKLTVTLEDLNFSEIKKISELGIDIGYYKKSSNKD